MPSVRTVSARSPGVVCKVACPSPSVPHQSRASRLLFPMVPHRKYRSFKCRTLPPVIGGRSTKRVAHASVIVAQESSAMIRSNGRPELSGTAERLQKQGGAVQSWRADATQSARASTHTCRSVGRAPKAGLDY
jgi:hypothetical protein